MFMMLKFFGLAVVAVFITIVLAPVFTGSGGDESEDVEQFKMKAPDPKPYSLKTSPTLDQLKALVSNDETDGLSLNFSSLKSLAAQNPDELIAAIKSGAKGEIPHNTEELVISAVEKARELIEKDDLFVSPGHTKPQE